MEGYVRKIFQIVSNDEKKMEMRQWIIAELVG